jgi:Mitochondrial fission regulator
MKEAALGFGFSVLELAGGVIHDVYDKIANPPQLKQMLRKYQINQKRRRRRVFRHLRHEFGVEQLPPSSDDEEEEYDPGSISLFGTSERAFASSSSSSSSCSGTAPAGQKIQKLEAELASLREAMAAFVSSGGATPLPAALLSSEAVEAPERSAPMPPPPPSASTTPASSMTGPPPPPPPGPAPDLAEFKSTSLKQVGAAAAAKAGTSGALHLNSSAGSRVPIKRKREVASTGVSMKELMARSRSLRKVNRLVFPCARCAGVLVYLPACLSVCLSVCVCCV